MIKKILPHLVIVMSVIMIVLFVTDCVNDAMGFLRGGVFKTYLIIYIALCLLTAIILIASNYAKTQKVCSFRQEETREDRV